LTFVYLEMPKFKKKEEELDTMIDKWMFALTNLSRLLERPKALQERIFTRLFEQAEVARFTPVEREEYVASKKDYWDYYSTMKTSFDKGREEGRKEGREEGEHKKALDTARKMKSDGIPLESIARYTGLTVEEIASISG